MTGITNATTLNQVNVIFTTKQLAGFAHGPGSGTTTTATPGGVVQLVAPSVVITTLPPWGVLGGFSMRQSFTGTYLLVRFIPEPGLLVLLGSGVAGLALLGRRRWRR